MLVIHVVHWLYFPHIRLHKITTGSSPLCVKSSNPQIFIKILPNVVQVAPVLPNYLQTFGMWTSWVSYTFGSVVLAADSLCPKGCCCWVRPPWIRFVQAMLDQAVIWPVWTLFIWQTLSQPEAPGCQVLQELLPTGSQDCVLILNTHNHALQTHNPIIVCIHENTHSSSTMLPF